MLHKAALIILTALTGVSLIVGGAYYTITDLIEPQGHLFEGIMSFGLGIALMMILLIASTLGKTIMTFADILEQTTKLNDEIARQAKMQQQPKRMPSIFDLFNQGNFTIIDGSNKDNPAANEAMERLNEMLAGNRHGGTFRSPGTSLNDLTDKELEERLANAVKKDDYEKAQEIRDILKSRRSGDQDSDEKKSEE